MLHAPESCESIFYHPVVPFALEIRDDTNSTGITLLQNVLQIGHLWQGHGYTLWDSLPLHVGCDRRMSAWQPGSGS